MPVSPSHQGVSPAPAPTTRVVIPTPDGDFCAEFSALGLIRLAFPQSQPLRPATASSAEAPPADWLQRVRAAIVACLAGRAPGSLPPVDLSGGTAFQRQVWQALREIPRGQTRSYGQIARQIGRPDASRAVGAACGANPVPLLVPCHRVVAANGKLGGFSGGAGWKPRLLHAEGSWPSPTATRR